MGYVNGKTTSTGGNVTLRIEAGYDSVSRSGNTVSANIYGRMGMGKNISGTTTWSSNQFAIWLPAGGEKRSVKGSGSRSTANKWYESGGRTVSWNVTAGQTSLGTSVGFGWNASNASQGNTVDMTITFGAWTLWNDINAYKPDGSTQNGLIFDLRTSDGGSWTNLTNEPSNFTKVYGTTATISNIRSNVTGAHYTKNSVTNNNASSFTWTFNSANYVVHLYSAWNTYTISYNANGGSGAPGNQTKTYGTNLTLSSTKPTRTGYTFLGWSTNKSATSATYSAGATLSSDLSTAHGATVTLYAIWSINSYYLDLNGWLDGASSGGLSPYGTATVTVNGTVVGNNVTDYYAKHNYGSTYSISNIIANSGYQYNGVHSGSINGTIGAGNLSVSLDFSTKKPSDLAISGTVNGPFEISLNWSATGLNCNYIVYANGTEIYSGTDTSFTYSCAEETTYNIYFTATNAGGTTTSNTISLTTPADQAKIRIKQDGVWKKGKTYYKKDGQWVKAKKIYIKINGQWKINNNYDS